MRRLLGCQHRRVPELPYVGRYLSALGQRIVGQSLEAARIPPGVPLFSAMPLLPKPAAALWAGVIVIDTARVPSSDESCRIFGHGSGAAGDELNCRASFERARSLGCAGVELDVRRTRDGKLAVVHDALLPDGRDVATTPAEELPGSIPLLEEILDGLAGMQVNIEIKNYRTDPHWDPAQRVAKQVVELIAARGGRDEVLISCFGPECLAEVRRLDPGLPTAQLLLSRRPVPDLLDAVVADGHKIVHPYDTMVDADFMAEARARGLRVHAWTAEDDSPHRLATLIAFEIDGLITGAPELALDLLRERL